MSTDELAESMHEFIISSTRIIFFNVEAASTFMSLESVSRVMLQIGSAMVSFSAKAF